MNIDNQVAFQVRSQVSDQVWREVEVLVLKINEEAWYHDTRLALWDSLFVARHFVESCFLEKNKANQK